MIAQRGLEWVKDTFGFEPRWTIEPKIDDIKAELRDALGWTEDIEVTFIAQGAFNKVYRIRYGDDLLAMRVSLPVDYRKQRAKLQLWPS